MNALTLFQFDTADIRVLTTPEGETLFVAKDICDALGYSNHNKAIGDHCRGVTKRHPLQTAGGMQDVRVIAEPDVLRLIVKSNLPSAVRFEKLVFEDILPTIRRTGGYRANGNGFDIPKSLPEALRLAAQALDDKAVAEARAEALAVTVAAQAPKVEALHRIAATDADMPMTEAAKVIGVKPRALIDWLRRKEWIYRRPGGRNWLAYQPRITQGVLTHKFTTLPGLGEDGTDKHVEQVLVTAKGVAVLATHLSRAGLAKAAA